MPAINSWAAGMASFRTGTRALHALARLTLCRRSALLTQSMQWRHMALHGLKFDYFYV